MWSSSFENYTQFKKKKKSSSTDEFLSLKYSIVRIPLKKRERESLSKHVRSTAPFLKKHIVKTMFCGHVLVEIIYWRMNFKNSQ